MKFIFGALTLILVFATMAPANGGLISAKTSLNPGATIDGIPVHAINGGYSNGVAVYGANDNRLFVEAGTQALCRVNGELPGVVPQGEQCYGGTSTSVFLHYNINVSLNDDGRNFFIAKGVNSFSVFYDYFLSASHSSTGFEALGSLNEFSVGSQGSLRSGSSGSLVEGGIRLLPSKAFLMTRLLNRVL